MTEILLRFCYLPENANFNFTIGCDEINLGYFIETINNDVQLTNSFLRISDVILEINGRSIAYFSDTQDCLDKIKGVTDDNGCVLTMMSRKDFTQYIRTQYLIDSRLNSKISELFRCAVSKFYSESGQHNLSVSRLQLLDDQLGLVVLPTQDREARYSMTSAVSSHPMDGDLDNSEELTEVANGNNKKRSNMRRFSTQSFNNKTAIFDNL